MKPEIKIMFLMSLTIILALGAAFLVIIVIPLMTGKSSPVGMTARAVACLVVAALTTVCQLSYIKYMNRH